VYHAAFRLICAAAAHAFRAFAGWSAHRYCAYLCAHFRAIAWFQWQGIEISGFSGDGKLSAKTSVTHALMQSL
jgi:hypothetical protein